MKITDYEKVHGLTPNNILLLDGENGTKTISAPDLAKALIGLLSSQDFISGLDMAALDDAEAVPATDMLLVATADGNKAISAEALAKALAGLMKTADISGSLDLSELPPAVSADAEASIMVGTDAGNKAITVHDLAKAVVKALSPQEFVAGLDISKLDDAAALDAGDSLLIGTAAGNKNVSALDLAKGVIKLLNSAEFMKGLTMSELTEAGTLTASDRLLVGASAENKSILAGNAAAALLTLMASDTFTAKVKPSAIAKVTTLGETDLLMLETMSGANLGGKAITARNLAAALQAMMGSGDIDMTAEMHRLWYRGKNLGSSFTAAQKAAVQAGTFDDLYLGDYWVIGGVKWRIVDMDYWLHCGDTEFTRHHLVIMPDTNLYTAKMNDTNITEGGYVNSAMYKTNLEAAKTTIQNAFGSALLTHRELLVNAVANGRPSGGSWYDSTVELPSEVMMYGSHFFTPANDGTNIPYRYSINKSQLALFLVAPKFIVAGGEAGSRATSWLRDVVSAAAFAVVYYGGNADSYDALYSAGVRPVFPIGG